MLITVAINALIVTVINSSEPVLGKMPVWGSITAVAAPSTTPLPSPPDSVDPVI
jgi:hypothetical protein